MRELLKAGINDVCDCLSITDKFLLNRLRQKIRLEGFFMPLEAQRNDTWPPGVEENSTCVIRIRN